MEAVGVVAVFVVVRESKTYAANESFWERGDADFASIAESKWDLMVVLPEPDSPLSKLAFLDSKEVQVVLQKYNSLILRACSEPQIGPLCHILGACHGTPLLRAIRPLGRVRVGVETY